MRAATRSLKLIDAELRDDEEANRLFLEILTSKNDAETVLRRMNEAGVLGQFIPDFGRIVAMMQFNMYHHYTVDEHLLRSIGVLAEIERGSSRGFPARQRLMRTIQPEHRAVLYVALFLHDIAKGRARGPLDRRRAHRAAALPALRLQRRRDRDWSPGWSRIILSCRRRAVARPLRPQDHREFRRRRAVARSG